MREVLPPPVLPVAPVSRVPPSTRRAPPPTAEVADELPPPSMVLLGMAPVRLMVDELPIAHILAGIVGGGPVRNDTGPDGYRLA